MAGISVAVVLFGASIFPLGPHAGADSIGTTKDQIGALEAQVSAGAVQIRALTLAYEQDSVQAATLAAEVTSDEAQLGQTEAQVSSTGEALQADAVISYMDGTSDPETSGLAAVRDPSVRVEYLSVAAGDIDDVVDQYRTQERQLATAEAALASEQQAKESAAIATSAARQNALQAAGLEQDRLNQLEGQMRELLLAAAVANEQQQPTKPVLQGPPVNNGVVAAVTALVSPGGNAGGDWLRLRECESGDNYRADTGNGYYGAYQFGQQTWADLGYPGRPDLEPPAMQDQAAMKLQSESGWGQWPACSAALGLT